MTNEKTTPRSVENCHLQGVRMQTVNKESVFITGMEMMHNLTSPRAELNYHLRNRGLTLFSAV